MKRFIKAAAFWAAQNWEESIRHLFTFYGMMAAIIIIPATTMVEDIVIGLSMPAWLHPAVYAATVVLVIVVCIAIGFLIGSAVTRPLRLIVQRHEVRERERLRALFDSGEKIYEKYEL